MGRRLGLVALAAVAACGGGGSEDPLDGLRDASETPVHARLVHGLVRDLSGAFPGTDAATFVRDHAALFGLSDVDEELSAPSTISDGTHTSVSYRRLTAGVPVFGAEIRIHSVDGAVVMVTAQLPSDAALASAEPGLSPAEAAARFNDHVGLPTDTPAQSVELVAFNEGVLTKEAKPTVLAYHVRSMAGPGQVDGFVDASSGALLLARDGLARVRERYVGHYEYKDLCGGACDLWDISAFAHAQWYAEAGSLPDATPSAQGALLFGALGDVYDYYATTFGRDSIDGNGEAVRAFLNHPMSATEHPALYAPGARALFLHDPFVAPEVIAHEYTHGVIIHASKLDLSFEPGALHESTADVMAVLATTAGAEWTIRQADDTLIRDLANPEIDHYASYLWPFHSEHAGGGPPSLAAYRLVAGGQDITPIGAAKLEQIYYRAITVYFQKESDITDGLFGLVQACRDFAKIKAHGIDYRDCGSIWNAFASVGLGERDDDLDSHVNSADTCRDVYNPEQKADCSVAGEFPMVPLSVPTCAPIYEGATTDATGWIPEDWPLLEQTDYVVIEKIEQGSTYYEFELQCRYDCMGCGAGAGALVATVRWQPYDLGAFGIPLPFDYGLHCSLDEHLVTGEIGPFRSSTHLAYILLNLGIPNNTVWADRQAAYLTKMLTSLEQHASACP